MALLLLACGRPPADATAYPQALAAVASRPGDAADLCASLRDPALRADCVSAGAERLAAEDASAAAALCASLAEGVFRDECHFQVAEKSHTPARCAEAGAFADDCRLHLWSQDLRELLPLGKGPGEVEAAATAALATYGLASDDLRPWSALYRELLGREKPLDRGACARAPSPALAEVCTRTGAVLYGDRLNRARDRKTFPCAGGPLPTSLLTTPDPELEQMLAERRLRDLCPEAAP